MCDEALEVTEHFAMFSARNWSKWSMIVQKSSKNGLPVISQNLVNTLDWDVFDLIRCVLLDAFVMVDRTATANGIETHGPRLPFLKDIEQNCPLHSLRFCSRSLFVANITFLSFRFRSFALFPECGTWEHVPTPGICCNSAEFSAAFRSIPPPREEPGYFSLFPDQFPKGRDVWLTFPSSWCSSATRSHCVGQTCFMWISGMWAADTEGDWIFPSFNISGSHNFREEVGWWKRSITSWLMGAKVSLSQVDSVMKSW
jgi:hypothetical protein